MDLTVDILTHKYHHFIYKAYTSLLEFFPRLDNWNRFDKFLFLNLVILLSFFAAEIWRNWSLRPIKAAIIKIIFKLPSIKSKVEQDIIKMKQTILNDFPESCRVVLKKIPYKVPDITIGDQSDKESLKGYLSGSRYPTKQHSDLVISLASKFSFSNPLHIDLFPYLKQMEVEVIHMCSKMINFTDDEGVPIGSLNSGGTESILLSILAYREYKYKQEGVRNPNLIICKTGHVAALKACEYFGVEPRIVGYDKNYEMDIKQMKKSIDSNTICVYTSYPNYPYGTVDPIKEIAAFCKKKSIPVHVDMCLGGFLVPFLDSQTPQKSGFKLPEGVTSVSLDPHKYGLSAKGASVSLFSDEKFRNSHLFTTIFWPGGLYATAGFAGSRSGVPISASWISMMKIGEDGYRKNAKQVQNATKKLASKLKEFNFNVYGKPQICCIAFDHPKYSVNAIQKYMKVKKWNLAINQLPICFHYSFTPLNCERVDDMIRDFESCLKHLEANPPENLKDQGVLQLYGACAKIPDSNTKNYVMYSLIDCFLDL